MRTSISYNLHNQHKQISMEFIFNSSFFLKQWYAPAFVIFKNANNVFKKNPNTSLKNMNL